MTDIQTQMKNFNRKMELLHTQLKLIKAHGLNEDLLIAYLCHKLKISEKKARQIINRYEEFYDNFIKKGLVDSL